MLTKHRETNRSLQQLRRRADALVKISVASAMSESVQRQRLRQLASRAAHPVRFLRVRLRWAQLLRVPLPLLSRLLLNL
jgi:hypothetical protein